MAITLDPLVPPSTKALEPGDLLTEKETAEALHVALQTVRNWRWRGEGPRFRKLGKRTVRYLRSDLAAFIEGKVAA